MKLWTRIRLGLGIVFGKRYGIIVDQDWARGGTIADFRISNADVGIYICAAREDIPPDDWLRVKDIRATRFRGWKDWNGS